MRIEDAAREEAASFLRAAAGADVWKRSKVGAVTGFGFASRLIRTAIAVMPVVGLASFIMRALRILLPSERVTALPTDSTDPAERFRVAARVHRVDIATLHTIRANTWRTCWFYLALAGGIAAVAATSLVLSPGPLFHPLDLLNRFCLCIPVLLLAMRAGFANFQVRTGRLDGLGLYLRTPSAWLPSRTDAPARPRPPGGRGGAIAMLGLGVVAAVAGLMPHPALAQSVSDAASVFTVPPTTDIWRHLLELIFPNVGPLSGTDTAASNALSAAFGSFLAVLMVLGSAMLSWHTVSGVVATAHEGKVLGGQWHTTWAPIRVVMGVGMLVPIVKGYAISQVLVLTVACWSGSFGNILWSSYINTLTSGQVSTPNLPQTAGVVSEFASAEFCRAALVAKGLQIGTQYNVPQNSPSVQVSSLVSISNAEVSAGNAINYLTSQFGLSNGGAPQGSSDRRWESWNYGDCGTIAGAFTTSSTSALGNGPAAYDTARLQAIGQLQGSIASAANEYVEAINSNVGDPSSIASAQQAAVSQLQQAKSTFDSAISAADVALAQSATGTLSSSATQPFINAASNAGWASAGTYYLVLSRLHGELLSLVNEFPGLTTDLGSGDSIGAETVASLMAQNTGVIWQLQQAMNQANAMANPQDVANALATGVQAGSPTDSGMVSGTYTFIMNHLFSGVFNAVNDYVTGVSSTSATSPLQQMVDFGQNILNIATTILLVSIPALLFGGAEAAAGMKAASLAVKAGSALTGGVIGKAAAYIASIASYLCLGFLLVGIVHAYVLPMIPYLIFLLFTVSMVILVAESMVAAPLWALVHIRMDGNELVGQSQNAGYQILFNLLLRIPLALFGLFLSLAVFDAGIWLLNATFYPAMMAAVAGNSGGVVGSIVMLILMTYLHWHLAIRSFSLITDVPDRVGRWYGAGDNSGHRDSHEAVVGFAKSHVEQRMAGVVNPLMGGMQERGAAKNAAKIAGADGVENAAEDAARQGARPRIPGIESASGPTGHQNSLGEGKITDSRTNVAHTDGLGDHHQSGEGSVPAPPETDA